MAFSSKVLALVARVLGQKYNIKIAMGHYRTASTDGDTIFLPLVSGDAAVELARGYVDHEAAHIRLTDFAIMPTKDFKGQLLNVIEDIRIEKTIGKDYPGCASNLRNLSTALNDKYGVFEPNPVNPSTSILAWISCRGRVDTLAHDSMVESAESSEPIARALFGNYFAEAQRLVAMIKTLPEDKSGTKAASNLRDQFMDLLEQAKDDLENPPPPPQPQEEPEPEEEETEEEEQHSPDEDSPEDPSEPEEGKGDKPETTDDQDDTEPEAESSPSDPDSENETEPDSDPETDPDAADGEPDSDSGEAEGEEGQDEESGSDPETGDDSADGSPEGGESEDEGEEEGGSESDSGPATDGDADGEETSGETNATGGTEGDTDGDDSSASQNQSQSSSAGLSPGELKVLIETLAEALGDTDVNFGNIGELLQELLNQAAVKDMRVYEGIPQAPLCIPHPQTIGAIDFDDLNQIKTHTAKLRAQLQGLIQASKLKRSIARRSGRKLDTRNLTRLSVGDDRLFVSREEKKGMNTAVMFINDGSSSMGTNSPGYKMHTATRSCYVALDSMYSIPGVTSAAIEFNDQTNTVYNLCSWGQKPDPKAFNHNSSGCTELSTALWCAWGELLSRPEPRKIAIIFSDGDTDSDDINASHAAFQRMKADGIECVGIGIQDRHLLTYLPKETRIINDLNELTPALLELLREKLLEAA